MDGIVDSLDASQVLALYVQISSGITPDISDELFKAIDVNSDNSIDSLDASLILAQYVKTSSGGDDTWD